MPDHCRFGPFEIDRSAMELRRTDGRPAVHLAPQAARLLLHLVEREGHLVTRQELYDLLWPEPEVDVDRGLNTLIRQIRTALDDDVHAPRYIRTYPKRGYRFLPQGSQARPLRRRAVVLGVTAAVIALGASLTVFQASAPVVNDLTGLSPAARESYLAGEYLLSLPEVERRREAIPRFEAVLAAEPDYAPAHAALADAMQWAGRYQEADLHARRALALHPGLPRAALVSGMLALVRDWDWAQAEGLTRQAVTGAPDRAAYRSALAFILVTAGRFDEARAELDHARRLDPVSALVRADLGQMYFYAGDMPRAAEACTEALTLADLPYAHECAMDALAAAGDFRGALPHLRALLAAWDLSETVLAPTDSSARALLEAFRQWRAERYVGAKETLSRGFSAAVAFVEAGRVDRAIDALRHAAEIRAMGFVTVTTDVRFAPLHDDPEFRYLIAPLVRGGAAQPPGTVETVAGADSVTETGG